VHDWQLAVGFVDRHPALIVGGPRNAADASAYFILLQWTDEHFSAIRDFRHARYAIEAAEVLIVQIEGNSAARCAHPAGRQVPRRAAWACFGPQGCHAAFESPPKGGQGLARCARLMAGSPRFEDNQTDPLPPPMYHVRLWVYDQILASGVSGPIEVFTAANEIWVRQSGREGPVDGPFRWRVESLDGKPVGTASGQIVHVDGAINDKR
jgi:hypothetical protein